MKRFTIYIIAIILIVFGFISTSISSQYPWKSIFITGGMASAGFTVPGKLLQINIDLGSKLSMKEIKSLGSKIKLIDKNGQKYRSSSYGSDTNFNSWNLDKKTGKKISWHADFSIFFKFVVPSKSSAYTLCWNGYSPLVIGNPFETPFMRIERKSGNKLDLESNVKSPADKRLICEVQELLVYLGYSPGSVDGLVGQKTQKAITEFQEDKSLPLNPLPDKSTLQSLRVNYDRVRPGMLKDKVSLFPQRPANGQVLRASNGEEIAPLEIVTPRKGLDFLVKLVDSGTKETSKTFYVRGGSRVKTRVPLGSFMLKYAAGEHWFGKNCLFGRKSIYSKVDKLLEFSRSENKVSGYTIELILQVGGNLSTSKISPDEW